MKKIFITGIGGFIGFHLARHCKARGNEVLGCDNFSSYYDPNLKRHRAQILEQEGIDVMECDILNRDLLSAVMKNREVTHLVHLAAQAGVRHSLQDPESYTKNNVDGFLEILEICRHRPSIKCIYASSSSVYGLNEKIPFSESDATDRPTSLYGATKKSNELMAHAYHHLFGINITGLRFFTVYGPWGRPDMAYFSFTKAILEGNPIPIFGDGTMQRDFTFIDDIVRGIIAAIDLGASYEIFNLGNNRPQKVLDLIAAIEDATGKKAIKHFHPAAPGDVPVTYADISKAQKMLGFTPKVSLHEGIGRFVKWYNQFC